MKSIVIILITVACFITHTTAQTLNEYQQITSGCLGQEDYECIELHLLSAISNTDEGYKDLYLLYTNMGVAQKKQGKLNEALVSYNKAYSLKNNSHEVLAYRASLKRQMNDLNGSLSDYNSALKLLPTNGDLLFNRAQTEIMLGDTLGAEKDYMKITELYPMNFRALTSLTNIRLAREEFELVLSTYAELISEYPAEPVLYNNRAVTYLKMKNYVNAMKDVNEAIKIDENFGPAYVTKAEILIVMDEKRYVLRNLQRAVKLGEETNYVFRLIDECNKY